MNNMSPTVSVKHSNVISSMYSFTLLTKKPRYRKDDLAMRPI